MDVFYHHYGWIVYGSLDDTHSRVYMEDHNSLAVKNAHKLFISINRPDVSIHVHYMLHYMIGVPSFGHIKLPKCQALRMRTNANEGFWVSLSLFCNT